MLLTRFACFYSHMRIIIERHSLIVTHVIGYIIVKSIMQPSLFSLTWKEGFVLIIETDLIELSAKKESL